MKLLFRPKFTLAAMITGVLSIATMAGGVVASLAPLESVKGLEHAKGLIESVVVVFGVIAALCNAIAGLGRSVAPMIDNGGADVK